MPSSSKLPAIPSPAVFAQRLSTPTARPQVKPSPASWGPSRHPNYLYWLDANIPAAFQHAGVLERLPAHLGEQLRVVEDVHDEWDLRAVENEPSVDPFSAGEERLRQQQRRAFHRACAALNHAESPSAPTRAVQVLGLPVVLDHKAARVVEDYRRHIARIPPPDEPPDSGDVWTNRGECASVCAAELEGVPAVLATNDWRATQFAHRAGLATRTMAELLLEMRHADPHAMNETDTWRLYERMTKVTRIWKEGRPEGPEFFRVPADEA